MSTGAIWICSIAVLAAGTLLYLSIRWRLSRRRILNLDWPTRFQKWQTMRRYSKLFLRHKGWHVRSCIMPEAELIIKKPSHEIAVQFLIEKNYYKSMPNHFITPLALGAEKRKRPVVLVTDFELNHDVISECNRRKVYPLCYKELMNLNDLIPSKREFRRL